MTHELTDSFGRSIRNLRISVTDRCNFRCSYCMPVEPVWLPRPHLLTFDEIERIVRLSISLGIKEFHITGGEPTARKGLPELIRKLSSVPGLEDLCLTTNGRMLKKFAWPLCDAGLGRINISLDTLSGEKFIHITKRDAFQEVWEGIEEAERVGFSPIKINTVVIRGINDDELLEFAALARDRSWQIRFIEFMPLDGEKRWTREHVLTADEIIERIGSVWPLKKAEDVSLNEPARIWRFQDGSGEIGVIASVSRPFCGSCDRIRITADGHLRTCLFSTKETDLRSAIRTGASDETVGNILRKAVTGKEAGHGLTQTNFVRPSRGMYSIGG